MDDYYGQLAKEALAVGAAFVPLNYIVSGIIGKSRISRFQPIVGVFIASAGFHLLAEATGLNAWYLHHSAASMRDDGVWLKRVKNVPKKEKSCGIRFCGDRPLRRV